MQPQTLASARMLERTSQALETALPDAVTAAITAARELITATASIGTESALADMVVEAIRNGRNIYTDKNIAKAWLDQTLATVGVDRAGIARANDDARAVLMDYADDIAEQWARALAPDATALTEAAAVLDDLDDPNIGHASQSTVETWRRAVQARRRFQAATEGWNALAGITGLSPNRLHRVFILSPHHLPGDNTTDAWTIAQAGITPALATLTEYRHRVEGYERARREEREAAERRRDQAGFAGAIT